MIYVFCMMFVGVVAEDSAMLNNSGELSGHLGPSGNNPTGNLNTGMNNNMGNTGGDLEGEKDISNREGNDNEDTPQRKSFFSSLK